MTKHEIARLRDGGLDHAEEQHGRRAEGGDYRGSVVDVAESGAGGHYGFDEEDADEGADPGQEPCFVTEGEFRQPGEWGEGEGWVWRVFVQGTVACKAGDVAREFLAPVPTEFEMGEGEPGWIVSVFWSVRGVLFFRGIHAICKYGIG